MRQQAWGAVRYDTGEAAQPPEGRTRESAMAVKNVYSIPMRLNRGWLQTEINPFRSSWPGPIAFGQILFIVGGALVVVWAATNTFIRSSGPGLVTAFVAWGLLTVVYLGTPTATKDLRFTELPTMAAYLPPSARRVVVRRGSDPSDFAQITGITAIDADGRIHFDGGGEGQLYLVVGTASYLLFDEDRIDILNHVDSFWRKVEPTCEWTIITKQEPQRVHHQVAALEQRNADLDVRDPDLIELQNEQYDVLTRYVGGQFASIHQYLLLRGRDGAALRRAHQLLRAEVENSSLMFRQATMLDRDEVHAVLRSLYTTDDDQDRTAGTRTARAA